MRQPATVVDVRDALRDLVVEQLEHLVAHHLPGWRVPRVFAGHPVGPDVRADLAFTLGFLADAGVDDVAGTALADAIATVLRPIDGRATHSFFSYRVAETLARYGPFDGNTLTRGWTDAERANLARACRSDGYIRRYERGQLPRNYAAVLARVELARQRIGLLDDAAALDRLVAATRELFEANPSGYLDDSQSGIGRYDIYTADVYLFTRPLADRLGPVWRRGFASALALVERTMAGNGAAITWGRSIGALATCLTAELGALALAEGLTDEPAAWLARTDLATRRFHDWVHEGLITAHQHRSTYAYRGPHRRLQMTLDCLGKLAEAAALLTRAPQPQLAAAPLAEVLPDRHELVVLDPEHHAGVWTFRSRHLAFVVPFVGATVSDYLPAPRNPGLFEVPVDAMLPTGVPFLWSRGAQHVGGGLPASVVPAGDGLVATYDGFPGSYELERAADAQPFPGQRRVTYRVDGRTLCVEEALRFDEPPDALALQLTETAGRPLRVELTADVPHTTTTVDVSGLKEYRSFWAELPVVHQIDVEPASDVTIRWSATPLLRVASSAAPHHYARAVFEPLSADVRHVAFPAEAFLAAGARERGALLRAIDVLHLHWPEWFLRHDAGAHREAVEALAEHDVRVLWTQHNLEPHTKRDLHELYATWAAAADAVVHHSEWGMAQCLDRYAYRPGALHRVVPHVHWGHDIAPDADLDRAEIEADLGLPPCAIRIGVLGAPRREKRVGRLMRAFARTRRDDLGLFVTSLRNEEVPDDPRITAIPYVQTSRRRYNAYLATMDVLALPFAPTGMLTTGLVGDVVGAGIPALVSSWPYLAEALGDAGIPMGDTVDEMTAALEALDAPALARARAASAALQAVYARERIAAAHLALLDELGIGLTRR